LGHALVTESWRSWLVTMRLRKAKCFMQLPCDGPPLPPVFEENGDLVHLNIAVDARSPYIDR
jgi:hypothetical protein